MNLLQEQLSLAQCRHDRNVAEQARLVRALRALRRAERLERKARTVSSRARAVLQAA